MIPVFDMPDAVKDFVAGGLFSLGRTFGPSTAIGFANEAEGLVAGFVYHNWEPENGTIELSGYSTRRSWVNKERVNIIFGYPFEQIGCRALVARHSEHNQRVRRIWSALGAEQTLVPELRGPGEAEVISVLTRETWQNSKFNEVKNGQTIAAPSS